MLRAVPLLLILTVMLTGIGLGAARGSVRIGDQVVLCTGHGLVVTRLPGEVGVHAHLCPDMALSWLALVDPGMVALPRRARPAAGTVRPGHHTVRAMRPWGVRVRGPPGGAVLIRHFPNPRT